MNEHICIIWCFLNHEHIRQCFDSIQMPELDYFVIENKSRNSPLIEEYFRRQRLVGYIQFEENIAANAVKIFLQDFKPLLQKYSYITFTDCDLLVDNIRHTFAEMGGILEHKEVGVCAIDLKMDNFPYALANPIDWIPLPTNTTHDYIECLTGAHLMTFKQKDLDIMLNVEKSMDDDFRMACASKGLKWVKTKVSKAKHLTWDYYKKGHEYYEFRINNPKIFDQVKTCNYKKIV